MGVKARLRLGVPSSFSRTSYIKSPTSKNRLTRITDLFAMAKLEFKLMLITLSKGG